MGSAVTREQLVSLNKLLEQSQTSSKPKTNLRSPKSTGVSSVLESKEEVAKLKEALQNISPDVPRGMGKIDTESDKPTDYWLGVVWAIRGLNWSCGKAIAQN
jgi:flagellar basal body P-ring protein FlgI